MSRSQYIGQNLRLAVKYHSLTNTNATQTSPSSAQTPSLTEGAVAGIIVGVVIILAVIFCFANLLFYSQKRQKDLKIFGMKMVAIFPSIKLRGTFVNSNNPEKESESLWQSHLNTRSSSTGHADPSRPSDKFDPELMGLLGVPQSPNGHGAYTPALSPGFSPVKVDVSPTVSGSPSNKLSQRKSPFFLDPVLTAAPQSATSTTSPSSSAPIPPPKQLPIVNLVQTDLYGRPILPNSAPKIPMNLVVAETSIQPQVYTYDQYKSTENVKPAGHRVRRHPSLSSPAVSVVMSTETLKINKIVRSENGLCEWGKVHKSQFPPDFDKADLGLEGWCLLSDGRDLSKGKSDKWSVESNEDYNVQSDLEPPRMYYWVKIDSEPVGDKSAGNNPLHGSI